MPEQAIKRRKARVTPEGDGNALARGEKKPGKGIQTPDGGGRAGAASARGGGKATRVAGKPGQRAALRAKKKVHEGRTASDARNGVSGTGAPVAEQATPAARRAAPVAKQTAPAARRAAPVAEQATPAARRAATVAEQAAPSAKRAALVAEQAALSAKRAATVAEHAAPAVERAATGGGQATATAKRTATSGEQATATAKRAATGGEQATATAKRTATSGEQATATAKRAATGGKQATATAKRAAPVAEQAAPSTKRAATVGEQATPAAKRATTEGEQAAPVAEQAAPTAKQTATEGEQAAPAAKRAAPVAEQAAPTAKRIATVGEQAAPTAKRAATVDKQAAPSARRAATGRKASRRASSSRNAAGAASGRATRTRAQSKDSALKAADRKDTRPGQRDRGDDLFLERPASPREPARGGEPPRRHTALFGALNACLAIAIGVLVALGVRLHSQYGEFLAMREVVDKQTFYEGTTVEGVDVSKMTLSNALDYWRERVEARNAGRTVTLDDGTSITAGELGYSSDYESVLTMAWSHGRSGTLEERYRMAASRMQNPAAYAIHRTLYSEALVDRFVQMQSLKVDQEPVDASVADFNVDTYEFTFNPSRMGRQLDAGALKRDLLASLEAGGGSVTLSIAEQPPAISTEQIGQMYGLIDYAITNASSSSKARLNNITLAMSLINGTKLAPGETFSFNERVGRRTSDRGFRMATAYSGGEVTEQVGGGICQVSTTLFNAAVKADMHIDERHNHSLTVHYVDKGKDATVDWGNQDLKFTNTSVDDIYICCYLTDDKRVRFGIFGRLLPDGEKITLDAVTVKVNKFETEYLPDPSLPYGKTVVSQNGRDGYKAEAYKVRWDAGGNELSKELLCTSIYKAKNEIVLYGT